MSDEITTYNMTFPDTLENICDILMGEFNISLQGSTSKIYHRSPAWFLEGNPIVGYYIPAKKDCVRVMFWSGQSFDEPSLTPEGSFKAATKDYSKREDMDINELRRWLEKSKSIQWDYKNIVKKRGELDRI